MTMPIALSFDLDNTLWDVDSIIIAAERLLKDWMRNNVPEALEHYKADNLANIRSQLVTQHPSMVHDLSFMRLQVLTEVMLQTGLDKKNAQSCAQTAFDIFFEARNNVVFYEGALEVLTLLSEQYTLFALTNGNADIHRAGVGHLFQGALSSADVGAKKPDPKIFQALVDQHQLDHHTVIHIGDNLVDDIEGANNAGFKSLWVNLAGHNRQNDQAQPHAEVNHLKQLPDAIEKLTTH